MGLEFWALFCTVKANFELAKKTWEYLRMFPEWLHYLKQLDEKTVTLDKNMEALSGLEEDINVTLTNEGLRSGKKRRREVDVWLEHVKRTKSDVQEIKREIMEKKYLFGPWLVSRVDMNLAEVRDLHETGKFTEGLFLDVPSTSKQPLLTKELVGNQGYINKIMEWLNNPAVCRIGVYGKKGVGKTAILTHVQKELSQSTSTFEHVYWVSVPEQPSVHKLQDAIAKQVGLDLSDEEDKMREAKLHRALSKKGKCVIILDGVVKPFIEEVGIPNKVNECKLILSTLSLKDCKRMICKEALEIKPLSHNEAVKLFTENLSLRDLLDLGEKIKEIAESIVRECQGLPNLLVKVAERLRGVDDICEWKDELTVVRNNREGHAD